MVNIDIKLQQTAIGDLIVGHITRYDIYVSRPPQVEVTLTIRIDDIADMYKKNVMRI